MLAEEASVALRYAGFWLRAAAAALDGLIVSVPVAVAYWSLRSIAATYVVFLSLMVYSQLYLPATTGQSLGKLLLRLVILHQDGTPISLGTVLVRLMGRGVSGFTLGFGFLIAAWDERKLALHDRLAGTCVVRL